MRILFLHLSDLHIGSEENLNLQRIQYLTRSLQLLGQVDGVVLVFSGDLAKYGKQDEYQLVSTFVDGLTESMHSGNSARSASPSSLPQSGWS